MQQDYRHSIKLNDEELRMIQRHRENQNKQITREELIAVLSNVEGIPQVGKSGLRYRTIYEAGDSRGKPSGKFLTDYASFRGGSSKEVPIALIEELETQGVLIRAYAKAPEINAWKLNPDR